MLLASGSVASAGREPDIRGTSIEIQLKGLGGGSDLDSTVVLGIGLVVSHTLRTGGGQGAGTGAVVTVVHLAHLMDSVVLVVVLAVQVNGMARVLNGRGLSNGQDCGGQGNESGNLHDYLIVRGVG
jgi:hypothetical protein